MTIVASKVESLRGIHESSFGADMSGSLGSYLPIPFREGTCELVLGEVLESPNHVHQRVDGHNVRKHLPRRATLTFETNICTADSRATNAVAAEHTWQGMLFETWLGAKHLMTGTTVNDAGATTTGWTVTAGTTLRPGGAIAIENTAGLLELRELATKATNAITLKHAVTNAPSNGATVYGVATYFANPETTGDEFKSLGFVACGYGEKDRWVLRGGGMVSSPEIIVEPGQIARMKWTITCAAWNVADGSAVAANLVDTLIEEMDYVDANAIVAADSYFWLVMFDEDSASTGIVDASMIQITPAIAYAMPLTVGGINNVLGFVRTHVSPCGEIKFRAPYEDDSWHDRRDNDRDCGFMLQLGSSTGEGCVAFSMPLCQITDVQRVDVDGLQYVEVTAVPRHDENATPETSYEGIAQSAFRVHTA